MGGQGPPPSQNKKVKCCQLITSTNLIKISGPVLVVDLLVNRMCVEFEEQLRLWVNYLI